MFKTRSKRIWDALTTPVIKTRPKPVENAFETWSKHYKTDLKGVLNEFKTRFNCVDNDKKSIQNASQTLSKRVWKAFKMRSKRVQNPLKTR